MNETVSHFPFAAYPKGWFQVAYGREVAEGQVLGLQYFGRRLVCYRGQRFEDGVRRITMPAYEIRTVQMAVITAPDGVRVELIGAAV